MPVRGAPEAGGCNSGLASVAVHRLWGLIGFCLAGGLFFLTLILTPHLAVRE